ncbi:hypothetical protein ELI_1196 [Eubacterium callanderi]|uniref:Uncharacterized protein n=1 Tax=Eubacterium callanderi TaxID=53442 RepID=E3GKU2_9FIRM|nr:hypothetical protein ELI_1196 [Eubacterium callanderi]
MKINNFHKMPPVNHKFTFIIPYLCPGDGGVIQSLRKEI